MLVYITILCYSKKIFPELLVSKAKQHLEEVLEKSYPYGNTKIDHITKQLQLKIMKHDININTKTSK
jgi:hypothetical protein